MYSNPFGEKSKFPHTYILLIGPEIIITIKKKKNACIIMDSFTKMSGCDKKANWMLWSIKKRTQNKPENIIMPPYNLECTLPFW